MITMEATFQVVTPIFMSGADQNKAELRIPSIKGVLRFWWRAMNYHAVNGNMNQLLKEEEKLFGSTNTVASFQMRLSSAKNFKKTEIGVDHQNFAEPGKSQNREDRPGARYLGYGLMHAFKNKKQKKEAGELIRPYINHGQNFTIQFNSNQLTEFPESLKKAIMLLGLVGSVGSRSRRGFGCITLQSLCSENQEIWHAPSSQDELKEELTRILEAGIEFDPGERKFPPYTAISKFSRIDYLKTGDDPMELLDFFGRQMQRYRSWGFHGKVNGEKSEENFLEDHHWFKKIGYTEPSFHPQRVEFGLPHNYSDKVKVIGEKHDRRSSPLFVHIHQYSEKSFGLLALILPSEFLPDGEKINAGGGGKMVPQKKTEWKILTGFLDGKKGHRDNKTDKRYFSDKESQQPWIGGENI